MKVKVAKTSGFCMGVQRAMNKVLDAANRGQDAVYTYGPLIHNPQTVELLKQKEVTVVEDIKDLHSGTLLIRAHGIPPQLREKIKESGVKVCDATCPRVGSVQSAIKKHVKKGYTPIIVGDAGHPEIVGLMGYSDGRGLVINSVEEVDDLSTMEKVLVVAQTTQDEEKYSRIVARIKSLYRDVISFDTICESTHLRQEEVRRMAGKVDAVIVVGGKNSGNTRRLAEISKGYGVPTHHVESEEELSPEFFTGAEVVGVTAGASTPDWTIRRMVEKLHHIRGRKNHYFPGVLAKLLHLACSSGLLTALSALGLLMATVVLTEGRASPFLIAACALFVFSQQTVHNLSDAERIYFSSPIKGEFIASNRTLLAALAGAACLAALLLSLRLGIVSLITMSSAFALGITSNLGGFGGEAGKMRPGRWSREGGITTSLAWALALAGTSAAASNSTLLPFLMAGVCIFLISFLRLNFFALRHIQADKMLGRMTLAARLGEKKTVTLIYRLIIVLAAITAGASAARIFPAWGYFFAPLPLYFFILTLKRRANVLYPENNFFASVDAFMLLYLAVALFWYNVAS